MSSDTATADVRIERSIERLAPEWDELADRIGAAPFLRPGWFAAWRRAFGAGTLELITLRRDDRLAGVLPMERRRGVLRALANYHSPVFGSVSEDQDAARELIQRAFVAAPRRLSLTMLDETDVLLWAAQAPDVAKGSRVLTRPLLRTPVVEVQGDWHSLLAGLDRRHRKELRRCRRRLEEMGAVELEVMHGGEGLAQRLDELLAVESSGWKGEARTAIGSRPETRSFYQEVARWASESGMLRLFLLRLDGATIAADYALEHNHVRYMLKGGFDVRYARVAPGILLLEAGLEEAFRSGLSRVELGGRDDGYKLRWTHTARERSLLQIFPRTPLGLVDWGGFAYGRPAAKRLQGRLPHRRGRPAGQLRNPGGRGP